MKSIYIFDADGTLYDSGDSIKTCANLALKELGYPEIPFSEMSFFIGPPLESSFEKCGLSYELSLEACRIYRKHYQAGLMFKLTLYPGIYNMLSTLSLSHDLYIATSKPSKFALPIAKSLNIASFFKKITGAFDDGSSNDKYSILSRVLLDIDKKDDIYMIGDTSYDVLAGKKHNLKTIGLTYGYGKKEELLKADPDILFDDVGSLFAYLKEH